MSTGDTIQAIIAAGSLITAIATFFAARAALRTVKKMAEQTEIMRRSAAEQLTVSRESSQLQVEAALTAAYEAKQADIMASTTPRFDRLLESLPRSASVSADATYRAIRAYWSLQLEQYRYYVRGFVDDTLFRYWMKLRYDEYHRADDEFRALTRKALEDFIDPDFKSFMEFVFEHGSEPDRVLSLAQRRRESHFEHRTPGWVALATRQRNPAP